MSVQYAGIRPWRGIVFVPVPARSAPAILGYDVERFYRHARAYLNNSTGRLMVGFADDSNAAWTDRDTGLTGKWGRIRFLDAGQQTRSLALFWGDGSSQSSFVITKDYGLSYSASVIVGSGVAGDFDIARDFSQWLFETRANAAVYDVWGLVRDVNGAVVRDWTKTSVTGIDTAAVAVRVSYRSGARRINLFYENGGASIVVSSVDGLTFA